MIAAHGQWFNYISHILQVLQLAAAQGADWIAAHEQWFNYSSHVLPVLQLAAAKWLMRMSTGAVI